MAPLCVSKNSDIPKTQSSRVSTSIIELWQFSLLQLHVHARKPPMSLMLVHKHLILTFKEFVKTT